MAGFIDEIRKTNGRYETDRYSNDSTGYSLVPVTDNTGRALAYRVAKGSHQNQLGNKDLVVHSNQTGFTDMPFADRLLDSYIAAPLHNSEHNKGYKVQVKRKVTRDKKATGDTITTKITMKIKPL